MKSYSPAISILILGSLASAPLKGSQDTLAARTLIVYAANSPESVDVKNYYIQARFDVPSSANLCSIMLPDVTSIVLVESAYISSVKTPIQNCLNAAGKANILYIVLAYIRPYQVQIPRGLGTYSLDSYLADIWDQYSTIDANPAPAAPHRYYAEVQNLGMVYPAFQSFAAYRATPRSRLIYSVWRLDGPTPAIAKGLVDKATSAMNRLTGGACLDPRYDPTGQPDIGYVGGEWDIHRAAQFLGQAGFSVTEDFNADEFGSGAAPAKCPPDGGPTALYAGWYSLNNYNGAGVFNWTPGSIGIHLDSIAAQDPRGGPSWVPNALLNGITVTGGAMAEPYLSGMTHPAGLFRNLLEGANVGDAFLRNTRWLKWMIMNVGDPLYRPFPTSGKAPFNPPAAADSLSISSRQLAGGQPTTGVLNLATAAPAAGITVALSSSAPTAAAVPSSATVAPGAKRVAFPITTVTQSAIVNVIITATAGATVLSNSVTLYPLLGGLALSQNQASAGLTIAGTVYLNAAAPSGGATVALQSSDTSAATVPASVFIPAGLNSGNFNVNTAVVTTSKPVTITGSYGGASVQSSITVLPALSNASLYAATVNSGAYDTWEIYLSLAAPAGGAVITISSSNPSATISLPTTLTIPAGGRYGQVAFTAGTGPATAVLSASYGGSTLQSTLTIR